MYNRCLQAGKIATSPISRKITNGNNMTSFTLESTSEHRKSIRIDVNAFGQCAEEIINNYKLGDTIFIDGYLWEKVNVIRHQHISLTFILTAQFIGGFEHIDLFEELTQEFEFKRVELDNKLKIERDELLKVDEALLVIHDEDSRKDAELLEQFIKLKMSENLTE